MGQYAKDGMDPTTVSSSGSTGDDVFVVVRSNDVQDLRVLLKSARAVRVFDGGCLSYNGPRSDRILSDEPALVLTTPSQVAEAVDVLDVASVSDGMCMCAGDATLEFLDGEAKRLAAVGLHHGSHVRWSGWSGDAQLNDGSRLLEWLAALGLAGPLHDRQRADVQRDVALARQASWTEAAPDCVQVLADEIIATGPEGQGVISDVAWRMEVAYPDPVQRCRALLAWFGTGTAACTGYPSYEAIPGSLIESIPIVVVLAALDGETIGSPVWAGALRHIAGWKSRSDYDLRRVPADVWDELLDLVRMGGDADKRRRIERKHAEFRSPRTF